MSSWANGGVQPEPGFPAIGYVVVFALLALSSPRSAPTGQPSDLAYTSDGTNITITYYVGGGGHVAIPNSIDGLPVTRISEYACYDRTLVTSVTIPASVVNIEASAFHGCAGLTTVYVSGNAPTPGFGVFYGTPATIYYLPNTTGWASTYADRPTVLWNPELTAPTHAADGFAFCVTGTPAIPIAVDAPPTCSSGPGFGCTRPTS